MKTCPKCRASVGSTAKFCVKCGFNIKKFEEENQNAEHFCTECGTKFSGGTFCPECGYDIAKDLMADTPLPPAQTNPMDAVIDLDTMNAMAQDQLYAKEGFIVENEVLLGYTGKKRSIVIRSPIEEIYDSAFENNDVITFVEIENGIRIIGKRAFANCNSLVKINIPASVEKIYDDSFEGVKLEKLILTEYNRDTLNKLLSPTARDFLSVDDNIDPYLENQNGCITIHLLKLEQAARNAAEAKKAEAARKAAELKKAEEARKAEEFKKAEEARKAAEAKKRKQFLESWSAGKTVTFGVHGGVPIEWIVLEQEGRKALVISKYALEGRPFHNNLKSKNVTWENCHLRAWLNNEFLNNSFNSQEQAQICTTTVTTDDCMDTSDRLFLLNSDEVFKYFTGDLGSCSASNYAKSHGFPNNGDGQVRWWLRDRRWSFRDDKNLFHSARFSGDRIVLDGYETATEVRGVRPAMWIKFDK
ncbi:MAG: hypothetical protein E7624_05180 [Ruminococcaceae bacterium]|nr:hypothetical protein [Oscillospiraceae bacterium]